MYTQPVELEIGEHKEYQNGSGRVLTVRFPNGRRAIVSCMMTPEGRAELHVTTYEEEVSIFAYDRLCEKPE